MSTESAPGPNRKASPPRGIPPISGVVRSVLTRLMAPGRSPLDVQPTRRAAYLAAVWFTENLLADAPRPITRRRRGIDPR
ncbi:hypothetical protein GCM10011610_27900 [Nocardia rhizosphaerihabitans]|uniref:Uncharacterized protein n=1 Tax=Nocardia rhizosphaerihabitans TaxID=1691570 RepID=A0ABQ2KCM0_9NOCA|nr:hypothetical protein GCM10011610_27900 [Nocardia rhizosphaerihabitans]